MNKWLGEWVKCNYPDAKGDLFSCFIVRNTSFGAEYAQLGFMTPYVWMFIGTYEKLRRFIIEQNTITSLIQLEYSGFAGATVPICTFTLQKGFQPDYKGGYIRLSDFPGADNQAPRALEALANPDCGWYFQCNSDSFSSIPGLPIAYWASDNMLRSFKHDSPLSSIAQPRQGFATSDNNRFLRNWWEVSESKTGFDIPTRSKAIESKRKWFPCNKGGSYRRWYGNNEVVANWENDGQEMLDYAASLYGSPTRTVKNIPYYFREGITWGAISSAALSMRYSPTGYVFETKGAMCFSDNRENLLYCLALTNSSVAGEMLKILCPTLDFHEGPIGKIPVRLSRTDGLFNKVESSIKLARTDWDSCEISWDFGRHPLL